MKKIKDTFDDRPIPSHPSIPSHPIKLGAPRLAVRLALDPEGRL